MLLGVSMAVGNLGGPIEGWLGPGRMRSRGASRDYRPVPMLES